jgi:hypothetical protein
MTDGVGILHLFISVIATPIGLCESMVYIIFGTSQTVIADPTHNIQSLVYIIVYIAFRIDSHGITQLLRDETGGCRETFALRKISFSTFDFSMFSVPNTSCGVKIWAHVCSIRDGYDRVLTETQGGV